MMKVLREGKVSTTQRKLKGENFFLFVLNFQILKVPHNLNETVFTPDMVAQSVACLTSICKEANL